MGGFSLLLLLRLHRPRQLCQSVIIMFHQVSSRVEFQRRFYLLPVFPILMDPFHSSFGLPSCSHVSTAYIRQQFANLYLNHVLQLCWQIRNWLTRNVSVSIDCVPKICNSFSVRFLMSWEATSAAGEAEGCCFRNASTRPTIWTRLTGMLKQTRSLGAFSAITRIQSMSPWN